MRVVLDTNAVVSGLLNAYGQPASLINLVVEGELGLLLDERIFDEYSEVLLRPKFQFDKHHINDLLTFFKTTSEWVVPLPLGENIPDRDDLPFLEVALSGKADALVTGNKKDYGQWTRKAPIVTPTEFFSHLFKLCSVTGPRP